MALIDRSAYAETPKEINSWKIVFYCAILSFSGALHGFNTANISGVLAMKTFKHHYELDTLSENALADWTGWITSILILGSCVGAFACAPITDRFGRKISLGIFTALFSISAVLMSANPGGSGGRAEFMVGRALSGFGSGAASVIGTGYIAEIAPKAIRGGLSALYNANTMLSVGLAYWINYGSLRHISSESNTQWQVPMAVQALPGVILLLGLALIPESPRWLAIHGKIEAATQSLEHLRSLPRSHAFVERELGEICGSVEAERSVTSGGAGIWMEIFSKSVRKRMIMVMLIQVGFQFSGGNIITYYNTSILTSIGLTTKSTNYLFSGIYGLVKFIAVLLYCLYIIDRFGRRFGLFVGSTLIIGALLYLTVYLAVAHPSTDATSQTGAAGWVAVVAIYIFAIGYAISWGTIPWIINSEVFPNNVRSTCMAICITWQYLVNFALTKAQPNMVIAIHPWGPFLLFATTTTCFTTYCFFAYPETKGVSMERMDELFTMPWYKVGKASKAQAATLEGKKEEGNIAVLHKEES
ncbi:putative hexose transport-related protein [Ilyonectria sp. MPI-CAGE-AT-0026]|nr:putative hexose transport-related protein [Ilyonectria sp. MPI-CAGE-AT-0026]